MRHSRRRHNILFKHNPIALAEYVKNEYLEDGKCVLHIHVENNEELFNSFSMGKQRELSSDLYDYIEKKTDLVPREIPVKTIFHGAMDEQTKKVIPEIIKEHYDAEIFSLMWDRHNNAKKIILLALFGVAILTAYILLGIAADKPVWLEILGIISSFSLWEATDLLLLERPALNANLLNFKQLSEMEIVFENN